VASEEVVSGAILYLYYNQFFMIVATVEWLTREGATVIACDLNEEKGKAFCATHPNCSFMKLDVTVEEDWEKLGEFIQKNYDGKLDGLVNNAGIASSTNIENTTKELWDKTMAINLWGSYLGMKLAYGIMKKHGTGDIVRELIAVLRLRFLSTAGSIVNLSSTVALRGCADNFSYAASKAGACNMAKALANHARMRGEKIRCNSVHPSLINTSMAWENFPYEQDRLPKTEEEAKKFWWDLYIGEPKDVAACIVFLLSDESNHVNGTEFVVDGGLISKVF
jgi:3(or 17)beta-hydroxysteroid dehydrogenase